MSADYRQLEEFKRKLQELERSQIDEFMDSCCKELAARLLAKVIRRTPVDSGYLRRGWTAGRNQNAKAYVNSLSVTNHGSTYEITISNPVEYCPYVEYGHRTRGSGWVDGKFMLTISSDEIKASSQEILTKKLRKFMKEVFDS